MWLRQIRFSNLAQNSPMMIGTMTTMAKTGISLHAISPTQPRVQWTSQGLMRLVVSNIGHGRLTNSALCPPIAKLISTQTRPRLTTLYTNSTLKIQATNIFMRLILKKLHRTVRWSGTLITWESIPLLNTLSMEPSTIWKCRFSIR